MAKYLITASHRAEGLRGFYKNDRARPSERIAVVGRSPRQRSEALNQVREGCLDFDKVRNAVLRRQPVIPAPCAFSAFFIINAERSYT
jgi:hypothetical protein